MNFLELAKARYSLRKFDTKRVEPEKLDRILQAGRLAPTACNYQPQRILVLQEQGELEKMAGCAQNCFDAPVILLICYDSSESWKNPKGSTDAGIEDAAVVATHMMLQAAELGLGSTYVGGFDPAAVCKAFQLPESFVPAVLLPLGYPRSDAKPSRLHGMRDDLNKTVFYGSFTGKKDPSQV